MINAFLELRFEQRPWLDSQEIKKRHHELAASLSKNHTKHSEQSLADINEARQILESHSRRLRHLIAITFPKFVPQQKVAPDWELFSQIASLFQRVREHTEKRENVSTAIARALTIKPLMEIEADLKKTESRILEMTLSIEDRIRAIDQAWPNVSPVLLWQLAEEWTFCDRWNDSLHQIRMSMDGG